MKKQKQIEYDWFETYQELSQKDQHLVHQAIQVAKKAYAPYSCFLVGSAVWLEDGNVVLGNNQENIAYPSGMCAERVALFYAGANYPNTTIQTIAIYAEGDLIDKDACISPCGSCRQVIVESESRQKSPIRVILVSQDGKTWVFESVQDIFLFPFGIQ